MLRRSALIGASVLCALAATDATAGGFYSGHVGARGVARAGAFIAAPDSVLAMHYNPAGLSYLKGFHAETDLSLIKFNYEFERSCPCADGPDTPEADRQDPRISSQIAGRVASNQKGFQPTPFVGVAYGLPILDLSFGLAAWGPGSPKDRSFGEFGRESTFDQAQRYSSIDVSLLEANYAAGVALNPLKPVWDGLRIGATVTLYTVSTDQKLHLWANSPILDRDPEDPDNDIPAHLNVSQDIGVNWSAGISLSPIDMLTIGVSIVGERQVKASGTLDVTAPTSAGEGTVELRGNSTDLEFTLPMVIRSGIEFRLPDVVRAEASFVYERWSSFDQALLTPDIDVVILGVETAIEPLALPFNLEDTWSVRVGGELNLFEPYIGIQAGYFYEPSAVPPRFKDASTADLDKHGFGLGVSTEWYGFTFQLAGEYILMDTLVVTDSERRVVGPLEADAATNEKLSRVGNGTYRGDMFFVSASVAFSLDAFFED